MLCRMTDWYCLRENLSCRLVPYDTWCSAQRTANVLQFVLIQPFAILAKKTHDEARDVDRVVVGLGFPRVRDSHR